MKPVSVIVRRRKSDNALELFYINSSPRGYWVEGYSREEMHFECPRGYIGAQTKPTESNDIQAQNFAHSWGLMGEGFPVRIVKRLASPRGLRRLGY